MLVRGDASPSFLRRAVQGGALVAALACVACAPSKRQPDAPEAEPRQPQGVTAGGMRESAQEKEAAQPASSPSGASANGDIPVAPLPLPDLCPQEEAGCGVYAPAQAALDERKPERAAYLLEKIPAEGRDKPPGVHALLSGRAALESGSLAYGTGGKEAKRALERIAEARPVLSNPAWADLQEARARLALGEGEAALRLLVPLERAYGGEAEVQAALGIAYLSVGRVRESLGPLKAAARLDSTEPERFLVLGTAYMLVGDLPQAERNFRTALAINPALPRGHGDLGAALLIQGKVSEGYEHLKKASELEPKKATYVSNLAYAELLLKRPQDAKERAVASTQLDPNLASGWLNWGLAEVELGNLAAARRAFEKARELDPTDPRPKNNLEDLKALEDKGHP